MSYLLESSVTMVDTWVLYLIMGILLLGNIVFMILFILSVTRNNVLEGKIENDLREKLSKTEHDNKTRQPLNYRPENRKAFGYKIVPAKDKMGWYIRKGEEIVAYAQNKDEADEILKNLLRK